MKIVLWISGVLLGILGVLLGLDVLALSSVFIFRVVYYFPELYPFGMLVGFVGVPIGIVLLIAFVVTFVVTLALLMMLREKDTKR